MLWQETMKDGGIVLRRERVRCKEFYNPVKKSPILRDLLAFGSKALTEPHFFRQFKFTPRLNDQKFNALFRFVRLEWVMGNHVSNLGVFG